MPGSKCLDSLSNAFGENYFFSVKKNNKIDHYLAETKNNMHI